MKNIIKKPLSILLSALLILTYIPTYVFAQEKSVPKVSTEGVEALRQRLSSINNEITTELSLWNNRGYTSNQLQKLEDMMDRYIQIRSSADKIYTNLAENLNYQFKNDIDVQFFKTYKNQVQAIRRGLHGNAVTTLSDTQEITALKKTLHNKTLNMERVLSEIPVKAEKTLPNAAAQAAKAELKQLRHLIIKTLEKPRNNNIKFKEQLLAHLLDEELNINIMIARLQRVLEISQKEVEKKAIQVSSIPNMLETLKQLLAMPEGQAIFRETMEEGLTIGQKSTIQNLCNKVQGNNQLRNKLLKGYVPEVTKVRAAQSAADIARRAAKMAGVSAFAITAVLVLATVVTINADEANSFQYSMNPGTLTHRVKNGTADIIDMVAFYQLPTSRDYIQEHLEEFGAVVLLAVEAATTPDFDKIINGQIIKDQKPENVSVNNAFDKAIDEALNKSIDLEIPQA